ncbi:peroxide stress protein YaaA [Actinoplanes sp. NPDC026619]|uniref:YaaA family protein n=1 Tax=Actinoplanes sp. NPDC026619 TaxID=3155798 RepID=UPI0033C606FA
MLILLPPSEGKTPAAAGDPVDHDQLWLPGLATARRRVITRLVAMCKRTSARSVADSLRVLGLSEGQKDEIPRNAALPDAPAAPAVEVYTGVLYEALDAATLPPAAQSWLFERAVVFSGLWGAVRLGDRIPAYRCSVGVSLPGVGGLTAYWKKQLRPAVPEGLVLDLRSGAYGAMWSPAGPAATVRVLHERLVGGVPKRAVVSHFNKATKGRIVRALAESGAEFGSIGDVVATLRDLKYTVEEPAPGQLDVVVTEL